MGGKPNKGEEGCPLTPKIGGSTLPSSQLLRSSWVIAHACRGARTHCEEHTDLGASNINASLDPKHCKLKGKFNLEGHGSSQIDPP